MASRAERFSTPGEARVRLGPGAIERIFSMLVLAGVAAAILYGWMHRADRGINPEHSIGYALGIVGGVTMLILLAYPIRKRSRTRSRAVGSVGFWFRTHMLLGLLGPLAILYHSRFSWGALNSAVALGAMIVVAGSGLIGRFFYARVHRGFSGRKLELRALKQEMDALLDDMEAHGLSRTQLMASLQPFEDRAIAAAASFWTSAGAVVVLGVESRLAQRKVLSSLPDGHGPHGAALRTGAVRFFEAARRTAEFAFYDRLLRLWHLLHLPLFIVMVAAVILHIVAVHMY